MLRGIRYGLVTVAPNMQILRTLIRSVLFGDLPYIPSPWSDNTMYFQLLSDYVWDLSANE